VIFFYFFIIGGVYGFLHYFTDLTQKAKITAVAFIVIFISLSMYLEFQNDKDRDYLQKMRLNYEHNISIICKDRHINKKTYNISSRTFVGKVETKEKGNIFLMSNCK